MNGGDDRICILNRLGDALAVADVAEEHLELALRQAPVRGLEADDIDPMARGVGWLLSETGIPRRIKAAYLTDDHIKYLAGYAARLRGTDTAP